MIRATEEGLKKIGAQAYHIAKEILKTAEPEKTLLVIPMRGGVPIALGVLHALSLIRGESVEIPTLLLPASHTVEKRKKLMKAAIYRVLRKMPHIKHIAIVDEAISGSSSNAVRKTAMDVVRRLNREENRYIPVTLYILAAYGGKKLAEGIKKQRNIKIFPIEGPIVTTDNRELMPIEYGLKAIIVDKHGKHHRVHYPDAVFLPTKAWKLLKEFIMKGVEETHLNEIEEMPMR